MKSNGNNLFIKYHNHSNKRELTVEFCLSDQASRSCYLFSQIEKLYHRGLVLLSLWWRCGGEGWGGIMTSAQPGSQKSGQMTKLQILSLAHPKKTFQHPLIYIFTEYTSKCT